MENIKNTTKYLQVIKIVLIAMVFVVASPTIALADDYYSSDTGNDTYDYSDGNDIYDYSDGNDTYDYSDGYDTYNYGYNTTVTSGTGNYGNNYYSGTCYYPSYGYGVVTSGGYNGSATSITYPTYNIASPSSVTSGSYTGGTTIVTNPTYSYSQTPTVSSASYSANPVYYSQPVTYYTQPAVSNQVLAYTNTNPTPTLDSVYLSDVPYTGFSDYYGIIIFISILLLWSAVLAYMFLKRKIESETVKSLVYVNAEIENTDDSVVSDLINQNVSDNSDMSKVEEYARAKKVLLSSDATIKLIKLSRQGLINASEFINGVATGEWVAIGENQIK